MKYNYIGTDIEILYFTNGDVITTSDPTQGNNEIPVDPNTEP